MAGSSKKSSKKKSKTALLDDDEKAEKAADKEEKKQAKLVREAKLEQILAKKSNPNAVSPETADEIPKEVAEKARVKALKEEKAKQEAEQIELAKNAAELRNQEFIKRTQEVEAQRRAEFEEGEAKEQAKEQAKKESENLARKHFVELPFFDKFYLGLKDGKCLEMVKPIVIIQIIVFLIYRNLPAKDNQPANNLKNVPFLASFSPFQLFVAVFLLQIFIFFIKLNTDHKRDWIEQETERINVQSYA